VSSGVQRRTSLLLEVVPGQLARYCNYAQADDSGPSQCVPSMRRTTGGYQSTSRSPSGRLFCLLIGTPTTSSSLRELRMPRHMSSRLSSRVSTRSKSASQLNSAKLIVGPSRTSGEIGYLSVQSVETLELPTEDGYMMLHSLPLVIRSPTSVSTLRL
jgi:hypothetical protein